ncbi:hypothetical protein GCM10023169_11620 [Georgenia halophila]|uniref:Uncharacterized protein n=1 Tax=Georgenia halophila TaxID=620889 RepID=A0ABP8KUD5_9MICO
MFALNATEVMVVVLWILGVAAALAAWPMTSNLLQRIALIFVAIAVPVVGSAAVMAIVLVMGLRGRGRRHPAGPRTSVSP